MPENLCATLLQRRGDCESDDLPDFIVLSLFSRVYNAFGKTYLFDVDGWHLKRDNPEWESVYAVDAYHAGNVSARTIIYGSVLQLMSNH